MKALNQFLSDFAEILIPLAIIIGCVFFWARSTFKRHNIIVDYIKKNGYTLLEKEWYSTKIDRGIGGEETSYVIKYFDRERRLHKASLRVDESNNEIIIFKDEIIS